MANTVNVRVEIDQDKLERAVWFAEGTRDLIREDAKQRKAFANALAAGYRSGLWYDKSQGKKIGNTPAHYESSVKKTQKGYVGMVYTANYAAQKENHQHNTLLKAKG